MKNKKGLWIMQTVMLIVLAVLAELLSKVIPPLGSFKLNQFVSGSLVNFILIIGAFVPGLGSAGIAALICPIFAAFFGIMPGNLPQMVFVVMAGNITIVFITWLCFRASHGLGSGSAKVLNVIGVTAGSLLKSLIMWAATEKILVPILHVTAALEKVLLAAVSLPQIITAVIGGIAALLIMPLMKGFSKGRR